MNVPQFTADASLYKTNKQYRSIAAVGAADNGPQVSPALVGRWTILGCTIECAEVCTRFCYPTGWECCEWYTECVVDCPSGSLTIWWPTSPS